MNNTLEPLDLKMLSQIYNRKILCTRFMPHLYPAELQGMRCAPDKDHFTSALHCVLDFVLLVGSIGLRGS